MSKEQIHIYTDGACSGNPGKGGYGILMEWVGKPYKKEFFDGYELTTNNRMELLAVIIALEKISMDNVEITVFTDSMYVVNAVEKKWILGWVKKRFKDVKNPDLWKRFLIQYKKHLVKFVWVKGHNDHPQNERCDQLAVAGTKKKELKVDEGYVNKPKGLF